MKLFSSTIFLTLLVVDTSFEVENKLFISRRNHNSFNLSPQVRLSFIVNSKMEFTIKDNPFEVTTLESV